VRFIPARHQPTRLLIISRDWRHTKGGVSPSIPSFTHSLTSARRRMRFSLSLSHPCVLLCWAGHSLSVASPKRTFQFHGEAVKKLDVQCKNKGLRRLLLSLSHSFAQRNRDIDREGMAQPEVVRRFAMHTFTLRSKTPVYRFPHYLHNSRAPLCQKVHQFPLTRNYSDVRWHAENNKLEIYCIADSCNFSELFYC
jgi:hypothetical protein